MKGFIDCHCHISAEEFDIVRNIYMLYIFAFIP